MKKINVILSALGLAFVVCLSSCSMDKKVYSTGYHIEWNSNKDLAKAKTAQNNIKTAPAAQSENTSVAVAEQESTTAVSSNAVENNPVQNFSNTSAPVAENKSVKQMSNKVAAIGYLGMMKTELKGLQSELKSSLNTKVQKQSPRRGSSNSGWFPVFDHIWKWIFVLLFILLVILLLAMGATPTVSVGP